MVAVRFLFTVEVEAERIQGLFASRDEIEVAIQQALDDANPGEVEGDNGGQYELTVWDVAAVEKRR